MYFLFFIKVLINCTRCDVSAVESLKYPIIHLKSFKIIDKPEKIAIKDGYIYNGLQCIQKIEYLGKKNLIIGSKKDIVFLPEQKRKFVIYDSACKELKNIKWDFILTNSFPLVITIS